MTQTDTERLQRWRTRLALAAGYMPHNPVDARDQARSLIADMERAADASAEAKALRAHAENQLARYRAAAEAWQKESAARGARHQVRERTQPGRFAH